jgi:hypothetical protein
MKTTNLVIKLLGEKIENSTNLLAMTANSIGDRWECDGESYVEVPSLGFSLVVNSESRVSCVHIYSKGLNNYKEFPFEFNGLNMNSSRTEVMSVLGAFQEASQSWLVYFFDGVRFHFEFENNSKIKLISITSTNWKPGDF